MEQLWFVPIEKLTCDGQRSSHAFENRGLQVAMHFFNRGLIVSFRLSYRLDDSFSIGCCQLNSFEILAQVVLYIALLKVVIVDFDRARKGVVLGVDNPGSLPFTAPVRSKVQVDA